MRAAIYARVSSAAQRDAHTIENQLRTLPAFVRSQGWELVGTYIDDGRSAKAGKLEARDGFARLARDAELGKFDVLVVVDIDRLTRTDDMIERARILGPFQQAGIDIVTPSGGRFDLRSLTGELYVTLQAQFAAEENRKRAERIKAGKLRAIAEGRKPAGPTPYGLRYSRATGQWSIDEVAAAVVREIFARVIAGESCQAIAIDLTARGVPSPRRKQGWERYNVHDVVTKRSVLGEWTADKRQRLTMNVPVLIDERTWDRAQAALAEHGKRGLSKAKYTYLLEGLGVCGVCGSPMRMRTQSKGRLGIINPAAYVCRRRQERHVSEPRCSAEIVKVHELDERVWERIGEVLQDPDLAAELERRALAENSDRKAWQADIEEWRRKLGKLDRHEAAMLARFRKEQISEAALDIELASVARERGALRRQIDAAERAAASQSDASETPADEWVAALRALARNATHEERRLVVRKLVRRGGALFDGQRVKLTLRVQLGGAVAVTSAAMATGYISHHGEIVPAILRIRVVA